MVITCPSGLCIPSEPKRVSEQRQCATLLFLLSYIHSSLTGRMLQPRHFVSKIVPRSDMIADHSCINTLGKLLGYSHLPFPRTITPTNNMKPTAWILAILLPLSAVAVPQPLSALPATLVKKQVNCSDPFCRPDVPFCQFECPFIECCS